MLYNPTKKLTNSKWTSINSWDGYRSIFAEQKVMPANYLEYYQNAKSYFQDLANSEKYKEITKELGFDFNDKNNKNQINLPSYINLWANQIKNAKLVDGKSLKKANSTFITLHQAEQLANQWSNLSNLIQMNNWTGLNAELARIKNMTDQLNKQIEKNVEYIDLSTIVQTKNSSNMYSVMSAVEGLLSRIQGAMLEQEAIKFIKEKIPHRGVFLTGNITMQTGEQIKPDFVVSLFDNFKLQNSDGKNVYEFENGIIKSSDGSPERKNIHLTEYELQSLTEQTLGFSAKTSQGQITFHQQYNINKLIDDSLAKNGDQKILFQMMHIYQLGLQLQPREIDNYQRYAVSKLAINILGNNNAFIVTKNAIIPTYQYVDKLIKTGLHFSNKAIPSRGENTDFIMSFGNTNIIGPKS